MSEMKDWQHGIEIERLKEIAAVFAACHKPHVYGAFGLVKERDVALAMHENRLMFSRMNGSELQVCAIFKILEHGSTQTDFTGADIKLPQGSVYVSAFAPLTVEAGIKCIDRLVSITGKPIFIEIFQEHDISIQSISSYSGAIERYATKVMAGSEIKTIYKINSPLARVVSLVDLLTLVRVAQDYINAEQQAAVINELNEFEKSNAWAQHYSGYNKRSSWSAFALRGYDVADPFFIIKPAEMSRKWKDENEKRLEAVVANTNIWEMFPNANKIVDSIPGEKDRVRFMRLAPGMGELTRHADITDREAGTSNNKICRLHIPIISSPLVKFTAWSAEGKKIETHFPERALCYLDQRKPHCVVNGDPELFRVHLVIDVRSSAMLRKMLLSGLDYDS